MGEPVALNVAPFRSFPSLEEARRESVAGERLKRLRAAASVVREQLLADGPVAAVETCRLVTFPYPAPFAFNGFARSRLPFVMMTNRMQVLQFEQEGRQRTMLFNPTDPERSQQAPFFMNLKKSYGSFAPLADRFFVKRIATVQQHLARLGLKPGDIDYIAFDHLHTQDLREWLGGEQPYFPKAKLLIQRREWLTARNLHPMQSAWYIKEGTDGVPDSRVILIDGDAWLGKGVALIDTPGHTAGNMSLAVTTTAGICLVSENGVAAECYSPEKSAIRGLRSWARFYGQELVLNGNTREGSLDQYSSMVVEKTLAGPCPSAPEYVNFHPSSELTASVFAPTFSPTFTPPAPRHGQIRGLRLA